MSPPTPTRTPPSSSSVDAKRRWNERDWEVAMEAQSFVAVYADTSADSEREPAATSGTRSKKKTAAQKKTRAGRARKAKKPSPADEQQEQEAATEMTPPDTASTPVELFWLAQLQDDVTEAMLDSDAGVRVTWLNRVPVDTHAARYEVAYDEWVDVQSILCHVFLSEIGGGVLELTAKSAARVEKSLRRTRGEAMAEDEAESEDEAPPKSLNRKKIKVSRFKIDDDGDDDDGSRRSSRRSSGGRRILKANMPKKVSKRIAAMHIPPHYANVDATKYTDRELLGDHAFDSYSGDILSSNREVIRAVRTENYDLLTTLTEESATLKQIYSFTAVQSADVQKTALQYALDADDVKAVTTIMKAQKIPSAKMGTKPSVTLPSHSTGSHTSSFSDYNRRAINASRGGREGNNALLEDCNNSNTQDDDDNDQLWGRPSSSLKMMTVLYPAGEWVNDGSNPGYVAKATRAGNIALASKMVEMLAKNGGWGYNDLHAVSLSTTDQELPTFRSVSVVKKAQQTKITPLHFAAINPNTKYLETLWENGGAEHPDLRDDAQFEPIHYAAASESPAAVRFLLEKKANLLSRTKAQHTPLMRALINGREKTAIAILEFLASESAELTNQVLSSRGPESFQPIHFAAKYNCVAVLKQLLKMGVDVNVLAAGQTTALSLAARYGHFEGVKLLIAHGAKIDRADKLKKTPLLLAVKNGHTSIAAFLINNGANVNAYDSSENSIVHYAASYGWMSCLEMLHDAGADLWSRNSWGFVPLICAMLKQRMVCVDYILQSDTEQRFLDFRDRSGCTMLFLQCKHSTNLAQIKYLLEKGLDSNIGNCDDERPLEVLIQRARSSARGASPNFFIDAVRALVEHGAEVNRAPVPVETDEGQKYMRHQQQPLQMAIRNNSKEIFDFLLSEADADPFMVEQSGQDAWSTSASLGSEGSYYLEKLLDKFPMPRVMSNGNLFHYVAKSASSEIIPSRIVERLLTYCLNATELLHAKNAQGHTPVMELYASEMSRKKSADAAVLTGYKTGDREVCKIARLFAARVNDAQALKRYVSVWKVRAKGQNASSATKNEAEGEYVQVFDSTILHLAARRKLGAGSSSQWFGDDLLALILDASPLSRSLVNIPDRDNHETPLLAVVNQDNDGSAQLLIANGADVNYSSYRCKKCREELTQCASCSGKGLTGTALVQAVGRARLSMMRLLLNAGATTECCTSTSSMDSLLHVAMKAGDAKRTKLLLEHGASMITLNAAKSTPLAVAISEGYSVRMRKPHEGEIQFSRAKFGRGCVPPVQGLLESASNATTPEVDEAAPQDEPVAPTASPPFIGGPQASFSSFGGGFGGFSFGAPKFSPPKDTPTPAPKKLVPGAETVIDIALKSEEVLPAILAADEYERTPLHHAAAKRDLPLLRALLHRVSVDKRSYINQRDVYGRTALHFALNNVSMKPDASFDVERFLFLSGADALAVDNFGLSPLTFALRKIDMDWHHKYDSSLGWQFVKEHKEAGIYEAKKSEAFARHLHGTGSGQADPVETLSNLIAAGCDPLGCDNLGRTAMHLAASIGAFVCVSTLLSSCPSSRRPHMLELKDVDGFTPLGRAFESGRETTITTLIQSGASVSSTVQIRGVERSFFSVAVEKSMSGICHMLLNAGFSRRQAVEDAVCGNQLLLAKNLMVGLEISNDRGLLVKGNSRGETLLHCLAKHSTVFDDLAAELAWTLVDDGLDVSACDGHGNIALHYAAMKSNTTLMDFLLHHGSDVNAVNDAGLSPLLLAFKNNGSKCLTTMQYMLTRADLDLRARDGDGVDLLGLFLRYFLSTFASDSTLLKWFEVVLKKHGELDQLYSWMASKEELLESNKLGLVASTKTPVLVWASYAESMTARHDLVRTLIQHGASAMAVDSSGNSILMHLVTRNMTTEVALVLDECKVARGQQLRKLVNTVNHRGQTALHLALEPLAYGSYENTELIQLLVDNGASLTAKDADGDSALDYATRQASCYVFRFLKNRYPAQVAMEESEAFGDAMDIDEWNGVPTFEVDAEAYLNECEASGKVEKTRVAPDVNNNCDVGNVSSVYGLLNDAGEMIEGEEYNALLTKVDVKHGKFGINVFYRTQVVFDELQNIYLVFTNWGRIGEEGKFQNTPFHSAAEAVNEFKKIFKSKTSNAWEDRHNFEKRVGKYNLVQRVNFTTTIDDDVTRSFTQHLEQLKRDKIDISAAFAPLRRDELNDCSIVDALFAITDVRHLQLAASQNCGYYNNLPLARDHELRHAMGMLEEIRAVLIEQVEVKQEMEIVSGNLASDDATATLAELSDKFAALTEDLSERSSHYYEIVPRNEDRRGSAIHVFDEIAQLDKELYRLRRLLEITHTYKMLLGAKVHQKTIHPLEYVVDALQMRFTRLPDSDHERVMVTSYFTSGIRPGGRDQYRVSSVFVVARRGESERFAACVASNHVFAQQHSTLLWHGTKRTNLMGILSEGLRIAPKEAPHNGYAYGKGIYFSDVAAKSLNYCDYPYAIENEVEVQQGATTKKVTKTRQVQYMLLCEVALGTQRDASSSQSSTYDHETLIQDGVHSVRAPGQHMPNPSESIVSPLSGVKVPLGRVGQPGKDFERLSAWAVRPMPKTTHDGYSFQSWSNITEAHVDYALAAMPQPWKQGDVITIDKPADQNLFVSKGWYGILDSDTKLEIRVTEVNATNSGWDVGVEFVVTPPPSAEETAGIVAASAPTRVVVASARRYLNVLFHKPPTLPKGYSFTQPSTNDQYNEHIVYATEQARIRYIVEVERVRG